MPTDSRRITGPEGTRASVLFQKQKFDLFDENGSRFDGRKHDDIRPLYLRAGVVSKAKGSAYIEMNKTKIICSVYGPREVPRRRDFSIKGQLNCEFKFAPYSCAVRRQHQQDSQERQYSHILEEALQPVVCLHKFPKSVVDVYVYVIENDGSALAGAITVAGVALADAGIDMYDLVVGCSLRQEGELSIVDTTYLEECASSTEGNESSYGQVTLGFMPSLQQIAAFVHDGELTAGELVQSMKILITACHRIYPVVQQTLVKSVKKLLKELDINGHTEISEK